MLRWNLDLARNTARFSLDIQPDSAHSSGLGYCSAKRITANDSSRRDAADGHGFKQTWFAYRLLVKTSPHTLDSNPAELGVQSRSPTAKFERRWPKLQRIARSLCALSSPSASSDRTRAGRARSHPPPAGLSPPERPPARPTGFDEASGRFGEPDLRMSPWPYLVERQVGVPVMSCVGPREIALQPWVPVVWRCNHGSRCISVADPCILGSPRCSEVAAD